jgi:hypothetical protein
MRPKRNGFAAFSANALQSPGRTGATDLESLPAPGKKRARKDVPMEVKCSRP